MRKIFGLFVWMSLFLSGWAASPARAADKSARVWIVKPHPARMCADPSEDPLIDDAIKLEKLGVSVFESKIETDKILFSAQLDCGRAGYFVMAHWVSEASAKKAKKNGLPANFR